MSSPWGKNSPGRQTIKTETTAQKSFYVNFRKNIRPTWDLQNGMKLCCSMLTINLCWTTAPTVSCSTSLSRQEICESLIMSLQSSGRLLQWGLGLPYERLLIAFFRLALRADVPVPMFILNVCSSLKNSGEFYTDKVRAAESWTCVTTLSIIIYNIYCFRVDIWHSWKWERLSDLFSLDKENSWRTQWSLWARDRVRIRVRRTIIWRIKSQQISSP